MANAVYPKAKEKFLSAAINLDTDDIRVALIDTGSYAYAGSDEFLSSASGAVVGTPVALGDTTVTDGVFDAADAVFTGVTGNTVEALLIYKHTGDDATSPLIAYIDTVSSGLPVQPNGGDITVTWDNGGNKIFAL